MRARSALLVALAIALSAPMGTAGATHTEPYAPCVIDAADASAANAHIADPAGDWNGLTGNGTEDGMGELYREGVDLLSMWISRDEDGISANLSVASLTELQPNAIFYAIFYSPDTDGVAPDRSTRWVSARIRGYAEPTFTYGYLAQGVTSTQFFTEGTTTGQVVAGTPGTLTIDIPTVDMGIDASPGEYITFADIATVFDNGVLGGDSRVLGGSPEPLPPPSPLRHGFVFPADDMSNFYEVGDLCDVRL